MPSKSKKQFRKFKAMEARGEVSHKVADEFTKGVNYKTLPESLGAKKSKTKLVKQLRGKSKRGKP